MKKPDVLVLNRSYIPVHIVVWGKAMSLIYQETARPLDREYVTYSYEDWLHFTYISTDYPVVRTVNYEIAIPEIIVLKEFNKLPYRDVKYTRQTLFQRDHYRCAYCGRQFSRDVLTVDHIVPRDKGGRSTWENTITACKSCNARKSNKMLHEVKMKMLYQPKKPKWNSPLSHVKKGHPCKSWHTFLDKTLVDLE